MYMTVNHTLLDTDVWYSFYVNMIQMLPMLAAYPLMKRITHWPQAWLGLAINVGFVSSWVAIYGPQFSPYLVTCMMISLWW